LSIHDLDFSANQIFWSNILLLICCAFYLAWWLLAFKPSGVIKGAKTGVLLIPAVVAGLFSVFLAVKGVSSAFVSETLFPKELLLWGGIAVYFILLAVTRLLFKRPVTSELLLIVGWGVMALSEIDALYGLGQFSHYQATTFAAVTGLATLISLICYVVYYRLEDFAGYIDGMVPILMVALVMTSISVAMVL